jgi:hypothetical protein
MSKISAAATADHPAAAPGQCPVSRLNAAPNFAPRFVIPGSIA